MKKKQITKSQALARIDECVQKGQSLFSNYTDAGFNEWNMLCENSIKLIFDEKIADEFNGLISQHLDVFGNDMGSFKDDISDLLKFLNIKRREVDECFEDEPQIINKSIAKNETESSFWEYFLTVLAGGAMGFLIFDAIDRAKSSQKKESMTKVTESTKINLLTEKKPTEKLKMEKDPLIEKCNISMKDVERRLGEIEKYKSDLEKISKNKFFSHFQEVLHLYVFGFYKAAAFFSASIIENILRDILGFKGVFEKLIERAEADGIISKKDSNYINGLRLDRNEVGHELLNIDEKGVITVINITMAILVKITSNIKLEENSTGAEI